MTYHVHQSSSGANRRLTFCYKCTSLSSLGLTTIINGYLRVANMQQQYINKYNNKDYNNYYYIYLLARK